MTEVQASTAQYSFKVGGKTFQVLRFAGYEEINQLFRFNLTVWSDDPAVALEGLIRKDAEVKVAWAGKEKKFFGIVASCSQLAAGKPGLGGVEKEWGEYSFEVVPTLWLLSQKTNCRIFQDKSAKDIITTVLDERGMSGKYEPKLTKSYPNREYCVQYRENDLAFISRLMEEEGIFCYFTHDGKESMVLGDSTSAFGTCAPESEVKFKTASGDLSTADEYLTDITYNENAFIGKVRFKDYDYRETTKTLKVEKTAEKNTDLEIYDYHPERYSDDGRGRDLAQTLVDAESVWRKTLAATGTWRSASVGCTMTVSDAYRSDLNGSWLVVQVNHNASQDASGGVQYGVSMYAIPATVVPRPIPRTPKPALNPETATVVGPSGETIYMDELGRAKVQFRWDLEGKSDESSSCWIRVAQPFAGLDQDSHKKHGFHWHPLIGDEVVVDFLEGDPDRPLIVGSVYNTTNRVPVSKDELIRAMILTRYQHRLLMDDKNTALTLETGGGERVFMEDAKDTTDYGNNVKITTHDGHTMHLAEGTSAQGIRIETRDGNVVTLDDKNRNIRAETTDGHSLTLDDQERRILVKSRMHHEIEINDREHYIRVTDAGNANYLKIDISSKHVTVHADGDLSLSAGGNMDVSVDKSFTMTVGRGATINVTEDLSTTVGGGSTLNVSRDLSETIGGGETINIGRNKSETIGGSETVSVGTDATRTVSNSETTTVGSNRTDKTGSTHKVTASELKEQASTVVINGSTTTIKGLKVKLEAVTIEATASALNRIKGAMVKIN
jgi:type VI secretion system secreted protein VgrG